MAAALGTPAAQAQATVAAALAAVEQMYAPAPYAAAKCEGEPQISAETIKFVGVVVSFAYTTDNNIVAKYKYNFSEPQYNIESSRVLCLGQ